MCLSVAAIAGCTDPVQESPDPVAEPTSSAEATASVDSTAGPRARVAVFLVDGDTIRPAAREVTAGDLDAVVAELFAGPTESDLGTLGDPLTTAIPEDAEVLSVDRDDSLVTIDVNEQFVSDGGALGMRLRLAQLAYTLTALRDVESVMLEVEGVPVRMVGEGLEIENPLTRDHHTSVAPDALVESPLASDIVGSPMVVSGFTSMPGEEFILRLADAQGTIVAERLVTSDTQTGAFGVEVEYSGVALGTGTIYALSLEEELLMGVTIELE